jgi:ribose transport system substrate-binding protein
MVAGTVLLTLAATAWQSGAAAPSAVASRASAVRATNPIVAQAAAVVQKATARVTKWDGPTTGPKAIKGKFIIYVSADQSNGGARGVGLGVEQAAKAIGWKFKLIDGQGTVTGQTDAMNQAIALRPNGIVLGTVDARSQRATIKKAESLGIKIVGWHASPAPGPMTNPPVFMNVESNPIQTAKVAADYVIAESNGTAGVAILTDSLYAIAIAKSSTMRKEIERCKGCSVLAYENTPLADVSTRMGPLTTSLKQRFGKRLTWVLGINDLYFDFAAEALRADGIGPSGPPQFVSAGDGSVSAYNRIRTGQYQVATIPEPLYLHGWECVDELNRDFAGVKPSDYVTPVHLVTKANIAYDGGPKNVFDPGNNYQMYYKKIWGV